MKNGRHPSPTQSQLARADAAAMNEFADGSRARPYATAVAFPHEVGEVVMARTSEVQREALKLANRLADKYGRNRDGFLFVSAIATIVAAMSRDMAKIPTYGGEPRVALPQPTIKGRPRAEFIESMLIEQAEVHAQAHRAQEPGDSAPPSLCNVCAHLRKLGLPTATDDQVGTQLPDDAPLPADPAVLIFKGEMEKVRAILRAAPTSEVLTSWYAASALDEMRNLDRNELFDILLGGIVKRGQSESRGQS